MNIRANLYRAGKAASSRLQYETAMRLEPSFIPAFVNLADLYRMEGRDADGETLLRSALEISPESGDVYHALGLLLVRQNKIPAAMNALEESVKLQAPTTPDTALYMPWRSIVLGKNPSVYECAGGRAHERRPAGPGGLIRACKFQPRERRHPVCRRYAEMLKEDVSPHDPDADHLLDELRRDLGPITGICGYM